MTPLRHLPKNKCFSKVTATIFFVGFALFAVAAISGCEEEIAQSDSFVSEYQQSLSDKGPQKRLADTGIESLKPVDEPTLPQLEIIGDPNTKTPSINLTLEQTLVRALANSADIRIVSYDPSIAAEEITKAYADFDPAAFGRINLEDNENPVNSLSDVGLQKSRVWETGIKQRGTLGTEWSLSYALVRNWDDLFGRALSTRYEPMMLFQIRQPLLRDGWEQVNMAGVNIARLNHKAALASFRQKTEEVATQVTTAYWVLLQARKDLDIQQRLLDKTIDTFLKMRDRKGIDATTLHLKQIESALKTRQAGFLAAKKRAADIQDALLRFLSDDQLNVLDKIIIIPSTMPETSARTIDRNQALQIAMQNNPMIEQARLGIEVAEINIEVAKIQKMPRLDLVATARMHGLARDYDDANRQISDGDYPGYSVGLTYEYPLGNRQRKAELRKRRLERSKAVSILQNISDQIAIQVKERLREIETTHATMDLQIQAIDAAEVHLQTLEDTEVVRGNLTPEFLLVKLQAQESLANAQRAHIKAIVDFNNAMVQLAETEGTVLDLHQVRTSIPQAVQQ